MWPFTKTKTIHRYRPVDWDNVKTVEDITQILKGLYSDNRHGRIMISESRWNDPTFSKFLSKTVVENTYINDRWDSRREYDEDI